MKKKLLFACCLLGLVGCAFPVRTAPEEVKKPEIIVEALVDRADPFYKCGETATFSIVVRADDKPVTEGEVWVSLTLDGGKSIAETPVILGTEAPTVSGTLEKPGFLLCTVLYRVDDTEYIGYGSAGYEPERIEATAVMPDDFDEFWAAGRARVDAIPMDLQLIPMPQFSDEQQETFKLSMANIDNTRIYGWLSVPKGKEPPYPAFVSVPGRGVGAPYTPISEQAAAGALSLVMGVHTHDLGLPDEVYGELARGPLRNYGREMVPDPERYFFRRAILGIDRAVRYLISRPDWDGKHLVYFGSSQGGGMGLTLAGLNPEFNAVAVNVPARCEQNAYRAERGRRGAPQGRTAEERAKFVKASEYFDAVNFARKIRCPVIMSFGFIDRTCVPSSVYSAYNIIQAPKQMFYGVRSPHSFIPSFVEYSGPWINGQLGRSKKLPPISE